MPVRVGLDVLLQGQLDLLKNQRIGLVTNPTGVTHSLQSNVDALWAAGINLVALFGPEHGFSASAADATPIKSGRDPRTGLPIHSLYGETRKPTADMLADLDVMLFDLQDVGARFYTYTATLALTLQACATSQIKLIVLDRPNPLNGIVLEGPMLDPELQSFIGQGRLPIRYGLTIGELAQFYNAEQSIRADLHVIALQGWRREMWFEDTGLIWVPPSPGIPHTSTTVVYPGMCLVEGTNLSEGRGTALPFEIVGAPWLDGNALAEELNARRLDGVRFRAITFTPDASKHAGKPCYGIQVHVTDYAGFRPVATGLHLLAACRAQAPDRFEFLSTSWEGKPPHLDLLVGTPNARKGLASNQSIDSMVEGWSSDLSHFDQSRHSFLLY
jgi:uncharacterized protein YbbC (DUF1343 family)